MAEHICAVCDYGWIIEGYVAERAGNAIRMVGAHVVRSWSNGRGIGALSDSKHKDEYILDAIGDVSVCKSRVLFEFPLKW